MPGYSNKVIKLDFDLTDDPKNDPVWVIIRNPRLMPAKEITSVTNSSGAYDEAGKVIDQAKAEDATDKLIAKLAIAARVYDPTAEPSFDSLTGDVIANGDQSLLPPPPWTPDIASKLPLEIRVRIAKEFAQAQNPQKAQEGQNDTQSTSSLTPKASTTEPGAEAP